MLKTSGLLTIVIPCYNGESYIRRCTKNLSALREDISILFVNDGSEDASQQMIEEWMGTRTNSFLITKPNGGYSSAINAALDACESEYVMFLGIDDELVVDGIHKVVEHLEKNCPDLLAFTTLMVCDDENGDQSPKKEPSTVYSANGYYETDLFSLCKEQETDAKIFFTRDTSRCFKRSCIGDTRYFGKMGVSADGCFSILVACKAKSFEFLNVEGYVWHLHGDSVSSRKKTRKSMMDELSVWEAFFSRLQSEYSDVAMPATIASYAYVYRKVARLLLKEERAFAQKHLKQAKGVLKWLSKHSLPLRLRVKLAYPEAYRRWLKIRKNLLHR